MAVGQTAFCLLPWKFLELSLLEEDVILTNTTLRSRHKADDFGGDKLKTDDRKGEVCACKNNGAQRTNLSHSSGALVLFFGPYLLRISSRQVNNVVEGSSFTNLSGYIICLHSIHGCLKCLLKIAQPKNSVRKFQNPTFQISKHVFDENKANFIDNDAANKLYIVIALLKFL